MAAKVGVESLDLEKKSLQGEKYCDAEAEQDRNHKVAFDAVLLIPEPYQQQVDETTDVIAQRYANSLQLLDVLRQQASTNNELAMLNVVTDNLHCLVPCASLDEYHRVDPYADAGEDNER